MILGAQAVNIPTLLVSSVLSFNVYLPKLQALIVSSMFTIIYSRLFSPMLFEVSVTIIEIKSHNN